MSSFAVEAARHEQDDESYESSRMVLPTPTKPSSQHGGRYYNCRDTLQASSGNPTAKTPLNPLRRKNSTRTRPCDASTRQNRISSTTNRLFGPSLLDSRRHDKKNNSNHTKQNDTHDSSNDSNFNKSIKDDRPTGMAAFFFGFMYEEPEDSDSDNDDDEYTHAEPPLPMWNPLNRALCLCYALSSAAAAVPVTLLPFLHDEFASWQSQSALASQAAASAVLGTACGKFINGPMGDVFGARRVSCFYSLCLAMTLLSIALVTSEQAILWMFFLVEFFQSVQWPCMTVLLATHYSQDGRLYQDGIYITSLASRFGTLLAIPICSVLLQHVSYTVVAQGSALLAMFGFCIMYALVKDSPTRRHLPQNPIAYNRIAIQRQRHQYGSSSNADNNLVWFWLVLKSLFTKNLIPAIKTVLLSGTFWIVAIAHAGGSMVRSSERILGTYFADTSMPLEQDSSHAVAVVLDIGILVGLAVGGKAFSTLGQIQRKQLVARLYMLTIVSCYALAILAVPFVQNVVLGTTLTIWFQLLAVLCAGTGVAVQLVHIPGIVGTTFGSSKGLYAAYTDGVANGLSSMVWRIVGNAVQADSTTNNSGSSGWAYGWAAVALLVILCAVLMVEFMHHYFCRRGSIFRGGGPNYHHDDKHDGYETIIFV